jgi:putative flippase GtrA
MTRAAWFPHLRQGGLFVLVGFAQLALDSGAFIGATALGMPVMAANVCGRIVGATLGFWLNGRLTFSKERLDRSHALRFVLTWLVLTCLSTALIEGIDSQLGLHRAWMAKPIVEAALAVVSFFVSKHFVYR